MGYVRSVTRHLDNVFGLFYASEDFQRGATRNFSATCRSSHPEPSPDYLMFRLKVYDVACSRPSACVPMFMCVFLFHCPRVDQISPISSDVRTLMQKFVCTSAWSYTQHSLSGHSHGHLSQTFNKLCGARRHRLWLGLRVRSICPGMRHANLLPA